MREEFTLKRIDKNKKIIYSEPITYLRFIFDIFGTVCII